MRKTTGIRIESISMDAVKTMLHSLPVNVKQELREVIHLNLTEISGKAKEKTPKQTGATAAAIHVVHLDEPGAYETATSAASLLNEKIKFDGPEDVQAEMEGLYGSVYNPATHASVIEFGTAKRPAQPSLIPAFEEQEEKFLSDVNEVLRRNVSNQRTNRAR